MSTHNDLVKLLCKSILNRLENRKTISFFPRLRQDIQNEIFALVKPDIFTEEDLRLQALAQMGLKADDLKESGLDESDQFKAAKSMVKLKFGDDVLHGFYFQKPLKHVAAKIAKYFMASSHIEDVYEDDAELERQIVETVQKFNAADLH